MEERREPMASRNMSMLYGLGGRIRKTREQHGLSLTDLSIAVGSDKSALSKIEKGERVPNLETIGKLADEMGVPMILWFQEPTSSNSETIDDIVEGVYRVMQGAPEKKDGEDGLPIPPYAVYNIGGGQPENLLDYISTLQEELVRAGILPEDYDFEGHRELVGMQAGDVPVTYADSEALERDYGFTPKIGIREGMRAFAEWYAEYYK